MSVLAIIFLLEVMGVLTSSSFSYNIIIQGYFNFIDDYNGNMIYMFIG